MILVKTEAGQQGFKDRAVRLTPRQRSAFILFDGRRSVADVLAAGMGIAQQDVDQMVELGLLAVAADASPPAIAVSAAFPAESPVMAAPAVAVVAPPAASIPAPMQAPVPLSPAAIAVRTAQQRYQDAYPIATRLTAALGLRGFRLNLSVEAATNYEQLAALAPKIRAAVGGEKVAALEQALAD